MFNLGDHVCSKRTGPPITGIVYGIHDPVLYLKMLEHNKVYLNLEFWTNLYPHWKNKKIYSIYFDSPVKFKSQSELPELASAMYPEEDLELL